jgi:hypothetical protein
MAEVEAAEVDIMAAEVVSVIGVIFLLLQVILMEAAEVAISMLV